MKTILFPVLILFTLFCFVPGCTTKSTSQPGKDSATIIQLETDFTIALVKNDRTTFEKLLSLGFVYTENDKTFSRSEMINSLSSGADTVTSAYNRDMSVHAFGTTVVVTGWMMVKGKNNTGSFTHQYRFTDTWMKNKESWQLVAAHDYLMP